MSLGDARGVVDIVIGVGLFGGDLKWMLAIYKLSANIYGLSHQ